MNNRQMKIVPQKHNAVRSIAAMLVTCIISALLAGCGAAGNAVGTAEVTTAVSEAEKKTEVYSSPDGWEIEYQPESFTVSEEDKAVRFTCSLEESGATYFEISYAKDKMPREILYEQIADVEDARVKRYEGRFGGLKEDWAYTYTVDPEAGGDLMQQYDAIEHNGGTLLIHTVYKRNTDEDKAEQISDTLADTMSTLKFTSHEPQKEFSYVPGTYERSYKEEIEGKEETFTDRIVLNQDHTGTLSFQDDVPVTWSSWEIIVNDSDERYEYTVEGDSLLVKNGEEWISFERTAK